MRANEKVLLCLLCTHRGATKSCRSRTSLARILCFRHTHSHFADLCSPTLLLRNRSNSPAPLQKRRSRRRRPIREVHAFSGEVVPEPDHTRRSADRDGRPLGARARRLALHLWCCAALSTAFHFGFWETSRRALRSLEPCLSASPTLHAAYIHIHSRTHHLGS